MSYSTEASLTLSGGTAEIRNYHWREPLDEAFCDDIPVFSLSLSPVPQGSQARFPQFRSHSTFRPVGRLLFRPAGAPMQCVNAGGTQRLLMYSPERRLQGIDNAEPSLALRSPAVAAMMHKLAAELALPGFAREAMAEALMTMIAVEFIRGAGPDGASTRAQGGLAPWQLKRIEDAVNGFEAAAPTVSGLAEMVGVSPRHLLRAFRASRGMSVAAFIARARMQRACALIDEGAISLQQVANRCGFETAGGFSTAFAREVGCTPQAYRMLDRISRPTWPRMTDPTN